MYFKVHWGCWGCTFACTVSFSMCITLTRTWTHSFYYFYSYFYTYNFKLQILLLKRNIYLDHAQSCYNDLKVWNLRICTSCLLNKVSEFQSWNLFKTALVFSCLIYVHCVVYFDQRTHPWACNGMVKNDKKNSLHEPFVPLMEKVCFWLFWSIF